MLPASLMNTNDEDCDTDAPTDAGTKLGTPYSV